MRNWKLLIENLVEKGAKKAYMCMEKKQGKKIVDSCKAMKRLWWVEISDKGFGGVAVQ